MVLTPLGFREAGTGFDMAGGNDPVSPGDFDARLKKARGALKSDTEAEGAAGNAMSVAFRLGIELIAGIGIGTGIGWGLDKWLETSPIFLLIFFALGAAAGILNVMRAAKQAQTEWADDDDGAD